MILLPALAGLVLLATRRSSRRFMGRAFLLAVVVSAAALSATLVAGPHWPWIAGSVVLLLTVVLAWRAVRWVRCTHLLAYIRLAWFAWERIVEIRDAHAVYRSTRPVPPTRS